MLYKKNVFHLLIPVGILLLAACSGNETDTVKVSDAPPVTVTVATPTGGVQQDVSASGQVEAVQTANISTRMMGYINKIYVKVGDRVHKGQLLASISDQDILAKRAQADAMINEANAALANAQKDYERFTNLYKQQSASAKELDNVTLQYNAAKSRVEAAQQMRNEVNAMLTYTNITAPFGGVVTQKMVDAGAMANPGMPILSIEQDGHYQVTAAIAETDISRVKQGAAAVMDIPSTGKTLTGTVTQISQSSQMTGGQYLVTIALSDKESKGIYAGMYVHVSIPVKTTVVQTKEENTILVPVAALVKKDQLNGLYTISSRQTAMLRWVRLGRQYGDKVEVLSGMDPNDTFIVSADGKLYNGVPVKVRQ